MAGLYTLVGIVFVAICQSDGSPSCGENLKTALESPCSDSNLEVTHGGTGGVECNALMSKSDTSETPTIQFPEAEHDKFYSLFMVDPEAPGSSLMSMTFYLHWAVTNILGEDLINGNIGKGSVLRRYSGPSPPRNLEFHRYQFILFESSGPKDLSLDGFLSGQFQLGEFINRHEMCTFATVFQFRVKP